MFATECAAREPDIVEVEAAMAEAAGLANAAQGRLVALIADGLARGVWQQAGVQSASHWLTWQLGVAAGRPIGPAARPRPPRRQPPTAPYRHPTGERLDTRWLHLPPDQPPEQQN